MNTPASTKNEVMDTIDVLLEISKILNTKLDKDTLALCISLCEKGVNPEALAEVIKDLRRQNTSTQHNPARHTQ
ncbi:mitotic-spindle organizing protein 1-like protein [Absidia repens]|uniref:Mitotic-spindle organizing protein 1 n=1 Tax=Absidia repens TaxID=90262 RepID=A0A1X2IDU4_9FUNG|nr:mitotic-spindle organizing protein 1-like protein [Absidia repens]